eukprot:99682-Rhodomonas_salina.3
MLLSARYAMSATAIRSCQICRRTRYVMPGTGIAPAYPLRDVRHWLRNVRYRDRLCCYQVCLSTLVAPASSTESRQDEARWYRPTRARCDVRYKDRVRSYHVQCPVLTSRMGLG